MRKVSTFLCGITAVILLSGCGARMPDLTQEETDLISEYAVGILLKYDKYHGSRLVDTTGYETALNETLEEMPEEVPEEAVADDPADDTTVVDVSQDEEAVVVPATVEEYYGIPEFSFQYKGYELQQSYPADEEGAFVFAMEASEGTQLLVLHFTASNLTSSDQTLDMLGHGARFRVSVNGEASKGALATMLLNDMQTYRDVVPAGAGADLVSIVEVPQSGSIDSIEFVMRGNDENATMILQ